MPDDECANANSGVHENVKNGALFGVSDFWIG
jgi:hypothetical protein